MTEKEVSNKIDKLINQLKKDLLNVPYNSRGVWDRVKNWWQNLIKTPNNPENPYYLTNKFGALGKVNPQSMPPELPKQEEPKEEIIPSEEEFKLGSSKDENRRISLKQYTILKEASNCLEKKVFAINENQMSDNLKNLEMFRIIDNWAVGFKKQIMALLKGEVEFSKPEEEDVKSKPKDLPTKQPITENKILFKTWIKNVDNIHFFIEVVNHIFSDPVRYRKPMMSITEVLRSKGIASPKKGEEGTPLVISIRNEILRMIKKEIDIDTKPDESIFKPSVWSWAKNLPSWKKNKDSVEEPVETPPPPGGAEFEESDPSKSNGEDGSDEFLNI